MIGRSGPALAVFAARDAGQRKHLLWALSEALRDDKIVELVAEAAYEGEDTSLYLYSFYDVGWRQGHRDGCEDAFDRVYGRKAADVAARARARRKRRPR